MSIVDRLRSLIKVRGGSPTGVMTIEQGVKKLADLETENQDNADPVDPEPEPEPEEP